MKQSSANNNIDTNRINDTYSETNLDVSEKSPLKDDKTLKYPKVNRGEVYICDFGEPFEHEQSGRRYAIIVQNNYGNQFSPNTIVMPCTTQEKTRLPVHHIFRFSPKNMVNYYSSKVSHKINVALGESIITISKSRLVEYLGTMTEDFMYEKIQPIIDNSLDLKRHTEIVTKDLNFSLIKLLSFVNINELISVSKTSAKKEKKALKILQLFGIKNTQPGFRYLLDSICMYEDSECFNLETLAQKISETEKYPIDPFDIQKLIINIVEERFKLKSVTIDFIRLLNCLLNKEDI